jgi:hypothetical protein
VTAAIACETVRMKSQYNPHGVPRPHFRITRYVSLGGEAALSPAHASKALPSSAMAAPSPATSSMTAADKLDVFAGKSDAPGMLQLPTVSEPSLKEELGDEIVF